MIAKFNQSIVGRSDDPLPRIALGLTKGVKLLKINLADACFLL